MNVYQNSGEDSRQQAAHANSQCMGAFITLYTSYYFFFFRNVAHSKAVALQLLCDQFLEIGLTRYDLLAYRSLKTLERFNFWNKNIKNNISSNLI